MANLEIILILLAIIACLAPVAERNKIPFPVVLVVIGLLIGFNRALTPLKLAPEIIFLIFLPPLLYEAAVNSSWNALKRERRAIMFLSVRMVFITMGVLAVIIHYTVPGFTWPLSFLLGAILSPPDAIAAVAAMKGLRVPRKWSTIIEGESLLNDASALIAYRYALLAVAGSSFVYWKAGFDFLKVITGGIAVGIIIGMGFGLLQKKLRGNPATEIALTLLVAYVAYLVAENFHTSGVLAVVTAGLSISWRSFHIFTYNTRLQMQIFWQVLIFLLNGFVFILIGLQLPAIQASIGRENLLPMIGYGLLISAAAILIRPLLFVPAAYISVNPRNKLTTESLRDRLNQAIVISWSGMRGVVSLATALALPITLDNGHPFPQRDAILFITFIVILVTLIVQGLSFPALVRRLGVEESEDQHLGEERKLRTEMIESSLSFINEHLSETVAHPLRSEYEERLHLIRGSGDPENSIITHKRAEDQEHLEAEQKILQHQRKHIIKLHQLGTYNDEVLHKMEHELDLWDLRLHARMRSTQLNVL